MVMIKTLSSFLVMLRYAHDILPMSSYDAIICAIKTYVCTHFVMHSWQNELVRSLNTRDLVSKQSPNLPI